MHDTTVGSTAPGGKVPGGIFLDYDSLQTPEHEEWRRHRALLSRVRRPAVDFRGCLGLALTVEAPDPWLDAAGRTFVPDAAVRWASLADIPPGSFEGPRGRRESHWASVRRTAVRFGIPELAFGSEGRQFWDLRGIPYDAVEASQWGRSFLRVNHGLSGVLPAAETRLFRVFNALEWAMTAHAAAHRHDWRAARPGLPRGLPVPRGGPAGWVPRAHLAFPAESADLLFDLVTRPAGVDQRLFTWPFRAGLLDAAAAAPEGLPLLAPAAGSVHSVAAVSHAGLPSFRVRLRGRDGRWWVYHLGRHGTPPRQGRQFAEGDVLGREAALPDHWRDRPNAFARWEALGRLLGGAREGFLRNWFERQLVRAADGLVHAPLDLAAPAALGHALDDRLLWDVSAAREYFNEECQAFVLPALPLRRHNCLRGVLPGELAFDLTPADGRLL